MQSGQGKEEWVLEYVDTADHRSVYEVMGWTKSDSTQGQIAVKFGSMEQAIRYAQENKVEYEVIESHPRKHVKKAYFPT